MIEAKETASKTFRMTGHFKSNVALPWPERPHLEGLSLAVVAPTIGAFGHLVGRWFEALTTNLEGLGEEGLRNSPSRHRFLPTTELRFKRSQSAVSRSQREKYESSVVLHVSRYLLSGLWRSLS